MNAKRLLMALLVVLIALIPLAYAENTLTVLPGLSEGGILQLKTGTYKGFTYYFDVRTGVLVIIGEGKMPSFASEKAPWSAFASQISKVVLSSGITSISENAFEGFTELKSITIPDTVTEIAPSAFLDCDAIEEVEFAGDPEVFQEIASDIEVLQDATVVSVEPEAIEEQVIVVETAYAEQVAAEQYTFETINPVVGTTGTNEDTGANDGGEEGEQGENTQPVDTITYKYKPSNGFVRVEKYVNGKRVLSQRIDDRIRGGSGYDYTTTFEYDGNKLVKEVTQYFGSYYGGTIRTIEYTYDDSGRRIKDVETFGDTVITTTHTYDGDVRTDTEIYSSGKKSVVVGSSEYNYTRKQYDENGELTAESTCVRNSDGTVTITEKSYYRGKLEDTRTTVNTYNANGDILNSKTTTVGEYSSSEEITYTYDDAGNKTSYTSKRKDGYSEETTQYNYTYSDGTLASIDYSYTSQYDEEDPYKSSATGTFSYDNNLVKSVSVKRNNNTTEHTITYNNDAIVEVDTAATNKNGETVGTSKRTLITDDNGNITGELYESYDAENVLANKTVAVVVNGRKLETSYYYRDSDGIVSEGSYEYDSQGNMTLYEYYHDGVLTERNKFVTINGIECVTYSYSYSSYNNQVDEETAEYDEKGRKVSSTINYYTDGALTSISENTYEYDSNGNHTTNTVYKDANGNVTSKNSSTYDSDWRQISSTYESYTDGALTSISENTYEYDSNGNRTTTTVYKDADGNVTSKTLSIVDSDWQQLSWSSESYSNGKLTASSAYEYDDNNNLTASSYTSYTDGKKTSESKTTYENGIAIASTSNYYTDGALTSVSDSTYEYDSDGNCTTNTVNKDANGNVTSKNSSTYNSEGQQLSWSNESYTDGKKTSESKTSYENGTRTSTTNVNYDSSEKVTSKYTTYYSGDGYSQSGALNESYFYNESGQYVGKQVSTIEGITTKSVVYYDANDVEIDHDPRTTQSTPGSITVRSGSGSVVVE